LQDPTEKHFGDVGILDKYEDNNNNKMVLAIIFYFYYGGVCVLSSAMGLKQRFVSMAIEKVSVYNS
jgi:hypothetical protein